MKKLLIVGLLFLALPAKAVKIFATNGSGGGVSSSSATVGNFSAGLYAAIATGTTFYATPAVSLPAKLKKICTTVAVSGIGGTGDTVSCNTGAGSGLTVTSPANAAAGTTTCATGAVTVSIGNQVFCHIETAAATQPFLNTSVEYTAP